MFSVKNALNKDSNYNYLRQTILEMLRQRPDDLYFVYCFPVNKGWSYIDDPELWENPRIIKMPMQLPPGKRDNSLHFDSFFWGKVFDKYAPDIIWSQMPELSAEIKSFPPTFEDKGKPMVITQHHYVPHETLPYAGMDIIRDKQLVGTIHSQVNVFNSDYTKKLVEDCFEKVYKHIPEYNHEIIKMGVLDEPFYRGLGVRDKFEKFTIIYNHRLQEFKKWRKTFEVLDEIYKEGYDFDVIVTGEGNRVALSGYKFVKFKEDLHRYEDYIKYISKGHMNVTNSIIETFCISALESLACGQYLVAPNGITFPELVYEGYPYLYNSKDEQKRYIKEIMDKYRDDKTSFFESAEYIKEETLKMFTIQRYAKAYLDLFDRHSYFNFLSSMKPHNKKYVIDHIREHKVNFIPVWQMYKDLMGPHWGNQANPIIKIKRIMNELGFKDTFYNGEQCLYLPKREG